LAPTVPKFTPPGYRRAAFLYAETGKDKIMKNRKEYQSYPANFLQAMHLNELLGTNIDYENLTEDQVKGANFIFSKLSDWNRAKLEDYCKNACDSFVRRNVRKALKELQIKELLLYAAEGFDAHVNCMREMLKAEETAFCATRGITDRTHIYYQGIERLNLPIRIYHMMSLAGVQTVRDLLMVICSGQSVRNVGALSEAVVREILVKENLLPENFERPAWPRVPSLDLEAMIFQNLNAYGNGAGARRECG